ncbi:DUF4435 domain-containing protein [Chryseobacterium sp. PBS4-4]|uniref:DUF4435 domain-containing protein n=1 Tax=Chryseobacterium edaphi TaxID=2976532 RepID=A0ABT2W428_9FLAO|nr:DUF4435 domain-containing protein [Chryseobacterium edaphi]MCU7616972.1 DUF4435 domain-containing protein [Chryseobacterium edaphi]
MESHILVDRIANAIMMDKTFNGYHLIVEGNKDYKLYSKFFNLENLRITEAFGCEKVKMVLQILSDRNFDKKLGIIDYDFNKILNIKINTNNLFVTDDHDIEVMIIKTSALENTINIFTQKKKIEDFEKNRKKTIRECIISVGIEIGNLKLANKIYDLGLIFKPQQPDGNQIKYKDFINNNDLTFLGHDKLVDTVINYSQSKTNKLKPKKEILDKLKEVSKKKFETEHLVNGHDLSNILYILLKKTFSSTNKMLHDFNSIEDSLILAYEFVEFKKTKLYEALNIFENFNTLDILKK